MRYKKGFTLIELMVSLFIFSLISVLIGAILLQGQKLLINTDTSSQIQNEIRTSLLKIQNDTKEFDKIEVTDTNAYFDGDKWIQGSNSGNGRELLRCSNENEELVRIYAEVIEGNKHQLIEFDINRNDNKIIENSKNVLIDKINGDTPNVVLINSSELKNSEDKKINELITINLSNIVKGNKINENEYIISLLSSNDKSFDINSDKDNTYEDNNKEEDDNNSSDNENEGFNNEWQYDWKSDGIEITSAIESTWSDGINNFIKYNIQIKNNSEYILWDWQLGLDLTSGEITECYGGNLVKEEDKIKYTGFYDKNIDKGTIKTISVITKNVNSINEQNISFMYKKIIEPNKNTIDLKNGIEMNLYNYSQWDGTGKWELSIKNTSNKKVEKWELLFDCEKEIKNVSWGLYYEKVGENRYKIKNYNDNNINNSIDASNGVINLYFESYSEVVDRNLKNVEFNIVN